MVVKHGIIGFDGPRGTDGEGGDGDAGAAFDDAFSEAANEESEAGKGEGGDAGGAGDGKGDKEGAGDKEGKGDKEEKEDKEGKGDKEVKDDKGKTGGDSEGTGGAGDGSEGEGSGNPPDAGAQGKDELDLNNPAIKALLDKVTDLEKKLDKKSDKEDPTPKKTQKEIEEEAKQVEDSLVKVLVDGLLDDLPDGEDKTAIKQFEEGEMDYIAKAMNTKLSLMARRIVRLLDKSLSAVAESIKPIAEATQDNTVSKHFKEILEAHEDFETLRDNGTIKEWIASQPEYLKKTYQNVAEKGNSAAVIDMITRMKKEKGIVPSKKKDDKGSGDGDDTNGKGDKGVKDPNIDKKIKNLTAVKSGNKTAAPPGGKPEGEGGADDFDSAFEEAAGK